MKANETRWSLLARATLFFSVFLAAFVLAAPAFSDTISLPATGQRNCYDASGDQIACTGTGQDGELQVGVVWPIPRFALNADGCSVTDSLTGLMWTRGSKLMCTSSWLTAMTYVNTLAWCGRSDWRAANINELMSLYHSGAASQYVWLANSGFYKMQPNMYFSSTSYLNGSADNPSAFSTFIQDGSEFNGPKSSTTYCVWPVRLYGTGGSARVSQTGQTLCYDAYNNVIQCTATGQDGAYGAGVAWPTSRFFDNLDGTISDQFTDLMWTTNAATAGPDPATTPDPTFCVAGVVKTWEDALTFVKTCLNSATSPYLGYRDWRLPNKNELASLLDRSQSNPSIPAGHPFLNVVTSGTYPTAAGHWTSTTSTGARTRSLDRGYDLRRYHRIREDRDPQRVAREGRLPAPHRRHYRSQRRPGGRHGFPIPGRSDLRELLYFKPLPLCRVARRIPETCLRLESDPHRSPGQILRLQRLDRLPGVPGQDKQMVPGHSYSGHHGHRQFHTPAHGKRIARVQGVRQGQGRKECRRLVLGNQYHFQGQAGPHGERRGPFRGQRESVCHNGRQLLGQNCDRHKELHPQGSLPAHGKGRAEGGPHRLFQ